MLGRRSIWAVVFSVGSAGALQSQERPPQHPTPNDAWQFVQRQRNAASRRWEKGDRAGLLILDSLVSWLSTPEMRRLANAEYYFGARLANVWYDVMRAQIALGDRPAGVRAFEQLVGEGGTAAGYLALNRLDGTDSLMRTDSSYQRVKHQLEKTAHLLRDSAFVTPAATPLTVAQRVAGLSLLWARVKASYPDIVTIPGGHWDSLYMAAIPDVIEAADSFQYYRRLQRLIAQLGDAHSNVYLPRALADSLDRPAPLVTALVEGKVLVVAEPSPPVVARGIRRGLEILEVDGMDVHRYAEARVAPYVSFATPQDRNVRVYGYQLLNGPRRDSVALTLRDADGRKTLAWIPRDAPFVGQPAVTSRRVGDVLVVALNSFSAPYDTVMRAFERAVADTNGLEALILDLRANGGGSSEYGYDILARLLDNPIVPVASRTRITSGLYRVRGQEITYLTLPVDSIRPNRNATLRIPVALLIGPRTFSAAEDMVVAFDVAGLGPIIGERTGGSTGQPMTFGLPGGGAARVRVKEDRYPDGRRFIGVGIAPTIEVATTVNDVRAGRDAALERAIRVLRTR